MTASPTIIDATAYKGNGNDVWVPCLITNGNRGTVKFTAGKFVSSVCTEDTANEAVRCVGQTLYNLRSLANTLTVQSPTPTYTCLRLRTCTGTENCDARTCSSWGSPVSSMDGIPIVATNSTIPGTPVPTATPGDGQVTVNWSNVSDPTGLSSVFAYRVELWFGSILWIAGWTSGSAGERSVTIPGLTNGATYNLYVYAWSHNGIISSATGIPVVPIAPCVTPVCNFIAE